MIGGRVVKRALPFKWLLIGALFLAQFQLSATSAQGSSRIPCAVFCGGKKVINSRFFGDALNAFVTGPSINDWRNQADQVVDRGLDRFNAILSAHVKNFDDILKKNIQLLLASADKIIIKNINILTAKMSNIVETSISRLDNIIKQNIDYLDKSLDKNLGKLNIISKVSSTELEYRLKYSGSMISHIFAALIFFSIIFANFLSGRLAYFSSIFSIVIVTAILAMSYIYFSTEFSKQNSAALSRIKNTIIIEYEKNRTRFEFSEAAISAEKLQYLGRSARFWSAVSKKYKIVRDLMLRPALYRTDQGIENILDRIWNA